MDCIELLVNEHRNIARMLVVIRKAGLGIFQGKEVDYADFEKMIDFVKNYADKRHHQKEEKVLFDKMVKEIGVAAEKLVNYGMLVEHDQARLFMSDLQEALLKLKGGDEEAKLDIIASAISYTHLIYRHIDKEDNIAYPFAKRMLSMETMDKINSEAADYEREMDNMNTADKYLGVLSELEDKYLS